MTLTELESKKAIFVRQILNDVTDEDTLQKLTAYFQRLKKNNNTASNSIPAGLLKKLLARAEKEDEAGLCITSEDFDKEIEKW